MKKIFTLLTAILLTATLAAQDLDQPRHEFSIYAGGGLSTLQYDLNAGKHTNGFGGQGGLGYTFFFSPNWGLTTGAEIALYQAKAKLSGFSDSYEVKHPAEDYIYTYTLNSYTERQQAWYVNIPLMLQYQTGGKHKFFVALGGKVGFPVSVSAKTDDFTVATTGYFLTDDILYDDLPQHGFGSYNCKGSKTKPDRFKLNLMLSAELGIKSKIGSRNALYTGVYVDYGLANILSSNDKTFVENTPGTEPPVVMSPVVESQHAGNPFTDKIAPLSVGLKLRFAFGTKPPLTPPKREDSSPPLGELEEADTDGDGITDHLDKCPNTPGVETNQGCPEIQASVRKIFEKALQGIQFETGKDVIKPVSFPVLNDIVRIMTENPTYYLQINGHTDDVGAEENNLVLSEKRASAVRNYLENKGVEANRLTAQGFGESQPVAPNTSAANRAKNRRVEFVVKFEEEVPVK